MQRYSVISCPRKEYMDGINCDPFTFDMECRELNALHHKNESYDEIKSHHYIISFDPKDATENGLTGEQAQQIGMEYAKKNFPGHQALVCTHMDGHNGSGNIHVHIVINSLRKYDVERQDFMERFSASAPVRAKRTSTGRSAPCDSRAGYKHHVTKDYLIHKAVAHGYMPPGTSAPDRSACPGREENHRPGIPCRAQGAKETGRT